LTHTVHTRSESEITADLDLLGCACSQPTDLWLYRPVARSRTSKCVRAVGLGTWLMARYSTAATNGINWPTRVWSSQ